MQIAVIGVLIFLQMGCGMNGSGKSGNIKKPSQDGAAETVNVPALPPNSPNETRGSAGGAQVIPPSTAVGNAVTGAIAAGNKGTSGGTGGQTGFLTLNYSAQSLSSEYKIDAPTDIGPAKSYGLLIYLHGDGGGDYRGAWGFLPYSVIAKKYGLLFISVQSPNGGESWYKNGTGNAAYLQDLLQNEIYKKYNIDKNRIYFTGASGGSVFMTGFFLPTYGPSYRGGAIPICGGSFSAYPFYGGREEFTKDQEFLQTFKMFFYAGTTDYLIEGVKASINYYKSKGMQVESEHPVGVGHCQGSLSSVVDRVLGKWLAK